MTDLAEESYGIKVNIKVVLFCIAPYCVIYISFTSIFAEFVMPYGSFKPSHLKYIYSVIILVFESWLKLV